MRTIVFSVALLLLLPILSGCTSFMYALLEIPTPAQQKAYAAAHPELPDYYRTAILDGQIMIGMTKPDVVAALGDFHGFCGNATDCWSYPGLLVYFTPDPNAEVNNIVEIATVNP